MDFIIDAINNALGTELQSLSIEDLGAETLHLEHEFNRAAGFSDEDDELPAFFYEEPLPPMDRVARFHGEEINKFRE